MRFRASGKGLIGVDITSATVKLIELRRVGGTFQIDSYAVRPLREGAVVERRIRWPTPCVVQWRALALLLAMPR